MLGSQIIEIKIGFLLEKIGEEEISKAIEQSFYSSVRKYEEKDIRDNYLNMHTDFQFAKIVTDN